MINPLLRVASHKLRRLQRAYYIMLILPVQLNTYTRTISSQEPNPSVRPRTSSVRYQRPRGVLGRLLFRSPSSMTARLTSIWRENS
jgi:hypothetical protein